jgi:ankyrin repeat protein
MVLLGHRADPNLQDELGDTPLIQATARGDIAAVRVLLAHGADPNLRRIDDTTALLNAGRPDMVELLLAHGADANAQDRRGRSPLIGWAGDRDGVTALRALLAPGADVNARDNYGATPLIYAADDVATARVLLAHGADANAHDNGGSAALRYTSRAAVVGLLAVHGADLNCRDKDGSTALIRAPDDEDAATDDATSREDAELAGALLARGANPNLHDRDGFTPLMAAAANANVAVVRVLLRPDVAARTNKVDLAEALSEARDASGPHASEVVRLLRAASARSFPISARRSRARPVRASPAIRPSSLPDCRTSEAGPRKL